MGPDILPLEQMSTRLSNRSNIQEDRDKLGKIIFMKPPQMEHDQWMHNNGVLHERGDYFLLQSKRIILNYKMRSQMDMRSKGIIP